MEQDRLTTLYRICSIAHQAMLEKISKAQQRIVQRQAMREEFGDKALSSQVMFLTKDSYTNAGGRLDREDASDRRQIAELAPIVEQLEALFAEADERHMQAFADYIRQTYRK